MIDENYKPQRASAATLKRFFKDTNQNVVSVKGIFKATGRESKPEKRNRAWLANKLVDLRKDGLITSVYSFEGNRKLDKIRLTEEGKKVLGRVKSVSANNPTQQALIPGVQSAERPLEDILESVVSDIQTLKQRLPSFDVIKLIQEGVQEVSKR